MRSGLSLKGCPQGSCSTQGSSDAVLHDRCAPTYNCAVLRDRCAPTYNCAVLRNRCAPSYNYRIVASCVGYI
eukprot:1139279-Pelagomonas_calceolata.AAC.1